MSMMQGAAVGLAAPTRSKGRKRAHVSAFSHRHVEPAYYWMAVPAAIIFAVLLYWPFIRGIVYSFTNSQGYGRYDFIGLRNYGALFQDDRVGHAYLFTLFISVIITVFVNLFALFLAVALNSHIAFKNGFRAIFFIPYTLAVLVIGYVFRYLFMTAVPAMGQAMHIGWLSQSMLTSESEAWFPIVFLAIWQSTAYSTLLYLAGLQTIDEEIYEAASIDGANAWQTFWRITFPLIGPFLTINLVLTMKNAMNTFDQIMALTQGGPNSATESVTFLIFQNGLTGGEFAYQTANAVIFFLVLVIIAAIQLAISNHVERNR